MICPAVSLFIGVCVCVCAFINDYLFFFRPIWALVDVWSIFNSWLDGSLPTILLNIKSSFPSPLLACFALQVHGACCNVWTRLYMGWQVREWLVCCGLMFTGVNIGEHNHYWLVGVSIAFFRIALFVMFSYNVLVVLGLTGTRNWSNEFTHYLSVLCVELCCCSSFFMRRSHLAILLSPNLP